MTLYSEAPNAKQAEYIRAPCAGVADHARSWTNYRQVRQGLEFDPIPLVASAIMRGGDV